MKLADLQDKRAGIFAAADKLVRAARESGKDLAGAELEQYNNHIAEIRRLDPLIARCQEVSAMTAPRNPIAKPGAGMLGMEQPVDGFHAGLGEYIRTGRIMAADVPLTVGSGGGTESVGVTIPTSVLDAIAAYRNVDSFALAGARILQTPDTNALTLPVISSGPAASSFTEGQSATESAPFELDGFTLGGTKYSRLVKASEESLMNSSIPLAQTIVAELASGIAQTFTAAITTALLAALNDNASVLVAKGSNDTYTTLLSLLHSIPPRFAAPTNKWMVSRETLSLIKDARATSAGTPFFSAESGQIFGRDSVVNDSLTAGVVVFGDWQNGVVIRKSPFGLLRLNEAFASEGKVGFKGTQWLDQGFLCELSDVAVQPLYFTKLLGS